jgi:copper chaperone
MKTTILRIEGMSCNMCVKHVTHALEGVEGVTNVTVDLDGATATVTYDPAVATMAAFEAAVDESGYRVAGTA